MSNKPINIVSSCTYGAFINDIKDDVIVSMKEKLYQKLDDILDTRKLVLGKVADLTVEYENKIVIYQSGQSDYRNIYPFFKNYQEKTRDLSVENRSKTRFINANYSSHTVQPYDMALCIPYKLLSQNEKDTLLSHYSLSCFFDNYSWGKVCVILNNRYLNTTVQRVTGIPF